MGHSFSARYDSENVFRPALTGTLASVSNWFREWTDHDLHRRVPPRSVPDPYLQRKRELPNSFTSTQWQRALDYWGHKCAVCGRPRGLWHTISQDHWIPLSSPDCPGTDATNILPLCCGVDGCNNSKGYQRPETWLKKKLGKRRATRKLAEIEAYFGWVRDQAGPRLGCPHCGGRVAYQMNSRQWQCAACESGWNKRATHHYENCPKCQCWMIGMNGTYVCPRCYLAWDKTNLPTHEKCPGCQRGSLKWVYQMGDSAGWWRCNHCQGEWLFE